MPDMSLLKMYFATSAFFIIAALYGLVDSIGGLMYVPTRLAEDEWTVKEGSALRSRNTAKKHIGLR